MPNADPRRPGGTTAAPPPSAPPDEHEETDPQVGEVSWPFVAVFATGLAVLIGALYLFLLAIRAPEPPAPWWALETPVPAAAVPTRASAPAPAPTLEPTAAPTSAPTPTSAPA